jgi:hypothetical protein
MTIKSAVDNNDVRMENQLGAGQEDIGEIVSASVLGGLIAKLELENPEELRIGYPVIVEGKIYDFYCIVHNIFNQSMEIAERLAGSTLRDTVIPARDTHESYTGRIFYSKAELRPIQLIERGNGNLSEPQTIPPYFSKARHANETDVVKIYEVKKHSAPIGTLRGITKFWVNLDFDKLTEKPFGIFGRTGMGKSIFNKIICNAILARDVASVLIFDMHGEYGIRSATDNTPGLKYFFPEKVEMFSLDPRNKEAKPFIISPGEIRPADIIVAFEDLTEPMKDALFTIEREKLASQNIIDAIRDGSPEDFERKVHPATFLGLQRRLVSRLERFEFVKDIDYDVFNQIIALIKSNQSIVIDFGKYGTDDMVYLFIANIVARRLYRLYTEYNEEYPRLVVFLEEAHKFLDPSLAAYTIFNRLARETRKFKLILALVDQRPARINEEVRSQLANRLILSLKEPADISSALAGIPDRTVWEKIIGTIPARTVVVFGDAIRVPTLIEIMDYNPETVKAQIIRDSSRLSEMELEAIGKKSDKIF